MNSLIYVDAYYMSNLKKKKKKKGEKKIFFPIANAHACGPRDVRLHNSSLTLHGQKIPAKNLVENLRLTTKKGLFSTNIPRNCPLSMTLNLLGFVRKMNCEKNEKKKKKKKKKTMPVYSQRILPTRT